MSPRPGIASGRRHAGGPPVCIMSALEPAKATAEPDSCYGAFTHTQQQGGLSNFAPKVREPRARESAPRGLGMQHSTEQQVGDDYGRE